MGMSKDQQVDRWLRDMMKPEPIVATGGYVPSETDKLRGQLLETTRQALQYLDQRIEADSANLKLRSEIEALRRACQALAHELRHVAEMGPVAIPTWRYERWAARLEQL